MKEPKTEGKRKAIFLKIGKGPLCEERKQKGGKRSEEKDSFSGYSGDCLIISNTNKRASSAS